MLLYPQIFFFGGAAMNPHFSDITPREREILARVRFCPQVFLGEKSLGNFRHFCGGYQFAMETAGLRDRRNLLPDGLNEFTAAYLNTDPGTRECFTQIIEAQPDDEQALELFFRILDACLKENGLEPLPVVGDWAELRSFWQD